VARSQIRTVRSLLAEASNSRPCTCRAILVENPNTTHHLSLADIGVPPIFRTEEWDCKINGETPETEEAPVTAVTMDVSAEPAGDFDELLGGDWFVPFTGAPVS
jgi:hypothetical protein